MAEEAFLAALGDRLATHLSGRDVQRAEFTTVLRTAVEKLPTDLAERIDTKFDAVSRTLWRRYRNGAPRSTRAGAPETGAPGTPWSALAHDGMAGALASDDPSSLRQLLQMPALSKQQQAQLIGPLVTSVGDGSLGVGEALRIVQLGSCGEVDQPQLSVALLAAILGRLTADPKPVSGPLFCAHNAFHREALRQLVAGGHSMSAAAQHRCDAADAYLTLCATHGPPPPPEKGTEWAAPPQLISRRIVLMLGYGVPGVPAADAATQLVSFLFRRLSVAASASLGDNRTRQAVDGAGYAEMQRLEKAVVKELVGWLPRYFPREWYGCLSSMRARSHATICVS